MLLDSQAETGLSSHPGVQPQAEDFSLGVNRTKTDISDSHAHITSADEAGLGCVPTVTKFCFFTSTQLCASRQYSTEGRPTGTHRQQEPPWAVADYTTTCLAVRPRED